MTTVPTAKEVLDYYWNPRSPVVGFSVSCNPTHWPSIVGLRSIERT